MIICLDFDETFTADPDMWLKFIADAKQKEHRVICATMRYKHESVEVHNALYGIVDEIIYTGRKAKQEFLANKGIYPHIWIDDNPMWLFQDAR